MEASEGSPKPLPCAIQLTLPYLNSVDLCRSPDLRLGSRAQAYAMV